MGAGESNPVRNMDKRTARREYKEDFCRGISQYRAKYGYRANVNPKAAALGDGADTELDDLAGISDWADGDIRVYVRKRPIFKREIELGEFDVVTCFDNTTIVIHDARMHTDMKRQMLNHHKFQFDRVFNDRADNLTVYNVTTAPLVKIAADGGFATCFVYGQTGSGKTFTMSSIYEQAVYELFVHLEAQAAASESIIIPKVSVSFFEIAGDDCHDLLNSFAALQLLAGSDGSFHPIPVVEAVVNGPEELLALINHGRNVRPTAATGVHDASSRSHAVLRIYIHLDNANNPHVPGNAYLDSMRNFREGTLTLVDLAGSEHRIDSMYHSADRRKEGAYINASLMALKECIRARSLRSNMTHQYRKSRLTMALKQSFTLPTARTAVISCVSPASKDTEHSLNTLRHACIMDGQDSAVASNETRFVTGGEVETVQIGEINTTLLSKKAREARKAGEDVEAKTSNGNVFNENERELTPKEKEAVRRENEKRSIAKMDPKYRRILKEGRRAVNDNQRQAFRMKVPAEGLDAYLRQFAVVSPISNVRPRSSGGSSSKQQQQPSQVVSAQQDQPRESSISSDYVRNVVAGNRPQSSGSSRISMSEFNDRVATKSRESKKSKNVEESEPQRKSFEELRAQIYGTDGVISDDSGQRRQLLTLMRIHGFSEDEIRSLAPPSPTDMKLQQRMMAAAAKKKAEQEESVSSKPASSSSRSSRRISHSPSAPSAVSVLNDGNDAFNEGFNVKPQSLQRGNSARSGTQQAQQQQAQEAAAATVQSEYELRNARQQAAKERRQRQEEERKQALQQKIKGKHGADVFSGNTGTSAAALDNPEIQHRQDEISKLEHMLFTCDDLSAAAIFAINKQISAHRAALLKEQRGESTQPPQDAYGAAYGSSYEPSTYDSNSSDNVDNGPDYGNYSNKGSLPMSPTKYEPSVRANVDNFDRNVASNNNRNPPNPPDQQSFVPRGAESELPRRRSLGPPNARKPQQPQPQREWVNIAEEIEQQQLLERQQREQEAAAAAAAKKAKSQSRRKPQPEWQDLITDADRRKTDNAFAAEPEPTQQLQPAAYDMRQHQENNFFNNSNKNRGPSNVQMEYVPSVAGFPKQGLAQQAGFNQNLNSNLSGNNYPDNNYQQQVGQQRGYQNLLQYQQQHQHQQQSPPRPSSSGYGTHVNAQYDSSSDNQSQPVMYYGRRRVGVPAGAAAAPFGNEYADNN
jgi:hypothetical protein